MIADTRTAVSGISIVDAIGEKSPLTCPDCGGVLWEVNGGLSRYRCHTGHAYTARQLVNAQATKIEETLWRALRMFEEQKNLLNSMSLRSTINRDSALERISQAEKDIHLLRMMLQGNEPQVQEWPDPH